MSWDDEGNPIDDGYCWVHAWCPHPCSVAGCEDKGPGVR